MVKSEAAVAMKAWSVLVLASLVAADSSGYSSVIQLLNHRWEPGCPRDLMLVPPLAHPRAVGPCPTEYEVIHLPPNYIPNILMNARCVQDCSGQQCSRRGPFKCQEVPRDIKTWVVNPERPKFVREGGIKRISEGCICSTNPNATLTYNTPAQLVT